MKIILFILTIVIGFLPANGGAQEFPGLNPDVMLKQMDDVVRSQSHEMTVELDVVTKRWSRNYEIKIWMQGVDKAFARVLAPAKIRGQGFLRLESKLWNYLPSAERTILIPPSMMLDRFMGSDFSNDDFVKLTYLPRDYQGSIVGKETISGIETYHLELQPKEDAPVIYGKLEIWLRQTDSAPVRIQFYSEKMVHIRTLHYSEFKAFGDHETPTVWRMENLIDTDRETTVRIKSAQFGHAIDENIFSKNNLEREA